jgi:2-keto-4-pentenoate hydratase
MEKKAQMKELVERIKNAPRSEAEARARMANDSNYINVDGKFIKKEWIQSNPAKAQALYGWWFLTHQDEYKELFGEN